MRTHFPFGLVVAVAALAVGPSRAQEAVKSVVLLEATEPDGGDPKADRGLLLREFARQAVLIAARDELNLPTRDAVLGELRGVDAKLPRLTVRTKAVTGKGMTIELAVPGDSPRLVWEGAIPFPTDAPIDYLAVVTAAEKLARTDLPGALAKAGYKKQPAPKRTEGPTPRAVTDLIDGGTAVGQVGAARDLHGPVGPSDPAERDGGLTRAYANLGQLSAFQWTAAHKAFKARALLYAERLVAARPKSPVAHWHRAYARALAGFPAAALDSLAEAGRLRAALPPADQPAPPDWVKLVDAYCHRDYVRLVAATRTGMPHPPLAHLLCYLTLEERDRGTTFLSFTQKAITLTPDNFRYYDGVYQSNQLGMMHVACETAPTALFTHFPAKVAELPGVPSAVKNLAADGEPTAERLEGVVKGLVDAGQPGKDAGEPSWAALGRMAQEVTFAQAARDMDRQRRVLGWSAASCKEGARVYLPLLADHPYRDFVASYVVDERRQPDVQKALLRGLPLQDLEASATPLLTQLRKYDGKGDTPAADATRLLYAHRDETADDLVGQLRVGDAAAKAKTARRLLTVSPHTAAAAVTLIESDWAGVEGKVGEWEKVYADAPNVQAALGKKYAELKKYDDAERCLKASTRLSGDHPTFMALADLYKTRGDMARWKETLDDYLKTEDLGLLHARVRVTLADYLVEAGKAAEAKPYATEAAETAAAWAMLCAAKVHETLGEWAEAERWVRETAEHYESSRPTWFLWCVRTGHGDATAARKLALDWVEKSRGSNDLNVVNVAMVARVTAGEPAEAYKEVKAYLKTSSTARVTLTHAALLAHELGEAKERDEWLALLIKRSEPAKKDDPAAPPPPPRPAPPARQVTPEEQAKANTMYAAVTDLTKLIRPALAADPVGKVNPKAVDELVAKVEPPYRPDVEYVAGRYFEFAGLREEAARHYKAAAGKSNRPSAALAAYRLRALEKKPEK